MPPYLLPLPKPLHLIPILLLLIPPSAAAEDVLRGHGGPVRAIAVLDGPRRLVTGSFDHAVIMWDIRRGVAERVLRYHEGAVNAVAVLPQGCFATSGEDGRIAIWCGDGPAPRKALTGHQGPVTSLALTPDGRRLVSGSFDATVRIWDIERATLERTIEGHKGPVTSVRVTPDGTAVLSGGFDGMLQLSRLGPGPAPHPARFAAPINAIAIAGDGEIIAASSDGHVRFLTPALELVREIEVEASPIAALALSPDGRRIAASGLKGGIAVIDRGAREVTARLVGPGLPVWSLAFDADSRTLFTGGADRVVRRWDAVLGEPIGSVVPEPADRVAGDPNERGAVLFRACQACHTLTKDGGNRAGPTLHGVFGRKIATAPGYAFSESLKRLNIVWNAETIAKLFEVGPGTYTPGTKMPEQTITDPADRKALVEWLERATRPR